MCQKFEISENK